MMQYRNTNAKLLTVMLWLCYQLYDALQLWITLHLVTNGIYNNSENEALNKHI